MKTLLDLEDDISTTRNLVECVMMAADYLPREQANAMLSVLQIVSERLAKAEDDVSLFKNGGEEKK